MKGLKQWKNEKRIELGDAVVIVKEEESEIKIHETSEFTPRGGAASGCVAGLVIGTVLGGPVGGLVFGAAAGALSGRFLLLHSYLLVGVRYEIYRMARTWATGRPADPAPLGSAGRRRRF